MPNPIRIEIYSRAGCHLCDKAKAVVEKAGVRYPIELQVVDIEGDIELERRYGAEIPVVCIEREPAFKYRVDAVELERRLRQLCNP